MCKLVLSIVCCAIVPTPLWAAQRIQFAPSKIFPNDPYVLHIDLPDGTLLDYELRSSNLAFDNYVVTTGPWGSYQVQNKQVQIPGNLNLPAGFYIARFKPRGAPDTEYSRFDMLCVDHLPTVNPSVQYGTQTVGTPPPGAYTIMESYDLNGQFVGYTRIDYETNPCNIAGYTMRFTKTGQMAYWNAGGHDALHWCISEETWPEWGTYRLSPGGTLHTSNPLTLDQFAAQEINVTYEDNGWQHPATQGLLGAMPNPSAQPDIYAKDVDLGLHYQLLPRDNRIPTALSQTPIVDVELAPGHSNADGREDIFMDTWHSELLAPNADGVLRVRYNETGVRFWPTHIQTRWSVTEDWVWRSDGIITRITQWWQIPPLSWRGTYNSTPPDKLRVDALLVDLWVPTNDPLTLAIRKAGNPPAAWSNQTYILPGAAYTLDVKRSDGQPYSGFLEFALPDGSRTLWRDLQLKPIYVSRGRVTIPQAAYGSLNKFRLRFKARPYLTNRSVNSIAPCPDATRIANAGTAAYSNPVDLFLGSLPPDYDNDLDVDATDLDHLIQCVSGPDIASLPSTCWDADLDVDGDVDQADFGIFQKCYTGSAVAYDPTCGPW